MAKSIADFEFRLNVLGREYIVVGAERGLLDLCGPMLRIWSQTPGDSMYIELPPAVLLEIAREYAEQMLPERSAAMAEAFRMTYGPKGDDSDGKDDR